MRSAIVAVYVDNSVFSDENRLVLRYIAVNISVVPPDNSIDDSFYIVKEVCLAQPALGFLLQCLREERRLSLRELAQLADIDHAYIYRLETGEKESPSDEVLSKLIRALKVTKREAEMLRYLAKHTETDVALVKHVLKDSTISYEIFVSVAGATFRGAVRPDYPKLIERVRRILDEENRNG